MTQLSEGNLRAFETWIATVIAGGISPRFALASALLTACGDLHIAQAELRDAAVAVGKLSALGEREFEDRDSGSVNGT